MLSKRKIICFLVLPPIIAIVIGLGIYFRHIENIQHQFWRDQMREFVREIKSGMTYTDVVAIIDKKPWQNRTLSAEVYKNENVIRVVTPLELNLGRNWVVILSFSNGKIARIHTGEFTNTKDKPVDAPNDIIFKSGDTVSSN
jgi:hypothetical protein